MLAFHTGPFGIIIPFYVFTPHGLTCTMYTVRKGLLSAASCGS